MSEGKNSTGRNLDFLAILWISADSLRFFAQNECAEARNFYIFSLGQRTAHMVEYGFDHLRGLRTGQAYCPIQRFSQIGTRQRLLSRHAFPHQFDGPTGPVLKSPEEIGRAPVWTPVPNAHLVCRLLLVKKRQ